MRFTVFPNRSAQWKTERDEPWSVVCDMVANIAEYESKEAGEWISLAVYGDKRSPKNSLRYAGNVLAITGLEGDHDAGTVSIEEAAERARQAGFMACLYTTASHTPEAPRWRILVPLANERPLSERDALMDRLNGALGGALTNESWTHSQAFLLGRVRGVPYRCINVA